VVNKVADDDDVVLGGCVRAAASAVGPNSVAAATARQTRAFSLRFLRVGCLDYFQPAIREQAT
jgi:hypothetical protein